jgi:hypothetical protein
MVQIEIFSADGFGLFLYSKDIPPFEFTEGRLLLHRVSYASISAAR